MSLSPYEVADHSHACLSARGIIRRFVMKEEHMHRLAAKAGALARPAHLRPRWGHVARLLSWTLLRGTSCESAEQSWKLITVEKRSEHRLPGDRSLILKGPPDIEHLTISLAAASDDDLMAWEERKVMGLFSGDQVVKKEPAKWERKTIHAGIPRTIRFLGVSDGKADLGDDEWKSEGSAVVLSLKAIAARFGDGNSNLHFALEIDGVRSSLSWQPQADFLEGVAAIVETWPELQKDPRSAPLRFKAGNALLQMGYIEQGVALSEEALRDGPGGLDPVLLSKFAGHLKAKKKFKKAASVLEAVHARTGDLTTLVEAAECLVKLKEHAMALELCQRVIELNPRTPGALSCAAECLEKLGRNGEALVMVNADIHLLGKDKRKESHKVKLEEFFRKRNEVTLNDAYKPRMEAIKNRAQRARY